MALKKSELYSSLWSSCDALRGGMDASQYKDYVLFMLFIKYVSDKYAGQLFAPITIPEGASFADMVALKGKSDIGDQINKKILGPIGKANGIDFGDLDFADAAKLGSGKEMVDRLTDLVTIFEDKRLDFSKNRADGDDILGDAYEYLMRHFATESGKSKGQFYTPAEVSRIMAQVIGIRGAQTTPATTVYDPTCGSGSLLLKVADEAHTKLTLEGQEKDAATSGLARMNMILHDNAEARIKQGNVLTDPKFKDGDTLRTFDYVVANPPFSDKRWRTGLDPLNDKYERFKHFGVPPAKQGDYAYLLHIVRSLKSTGKGACILPHGVLFRGNAEAEIRKKFIAKRYIKGIIGLPPNLFYGTGIPACIVVLDKQDAATRTGIFMIDASAGFMKDGPKNRLRARDIHKIVDAFTNQLTIPKFSRMVPFEEIEKNDFNLNLPRYIDSQEAEDLQNIEGHLQGGIPEADVEALKRYWNECQKLREVLFKPNRPGFVDLAVDKSAIKSTINDHPEFATFVKSMNDHFDEWRQTSETVLKALKAGCHPKQVINELSEGLLEHYRGEPLIDPYGVYQQLMDYWTATMQDDCYQIAADGWKAETYRIIETKKGKNGKPDKEVDKGWACDLVPKSLIVSRYFAPEQAAIDALVGQLEAVSAQRAELEDEHGGEDGALNELSKRDDVEAAWEDAFLASWEQIKPESHQQFVSAGEDFREQTEKRKVLAADPLLQTVQDGDKKLTLTAAKKLMKTVGDSKVKEILKAIIECDSLISDATKRIRQLRDTAESEILPMLEQDPRPEELEELWVLNEWLHLDSQLSSLKRQVKEKESELDASAYAKYPTLSEDEVKTLVVEDKWLTSLGVAIQDEVDRVSQQLTRRVKELAERYEARLPHLIAHASGLQAKVQRHLERMGFAWK